MSDKQLREQLNTLSPLSGGVVFGKEEAWDKLQARLDKKETPKITFRVWVAAAAILLLTVCIAPLFFREDNSIAKTNKPLPAPVINNKTEHVPVIQSIPALNDQPKANLTETRHRELHIEPDLPAIQVEMPQETAPASLPVNDNSIVKTSDVNAVNTAPPVMAVVHINDLERGKPLPSEGPAIAQQEPVNEIKKMPVLHINDVMKEAYEVKMLLRENRFSFGNFFSRPAYNEPYPDLNTEENDQPRILLKNIFNTQN